MNVSGSKSQAVFLLLSTFEAGSYTGRTEKGSDLFILLCVINFAFSKTASAGGISIHLQCSTALTDKNVRFRGLNLLELRVEFRLTFSTPVSSLSALSYYKMSQVLLQ